MRYKFLTKFNEKFKEFKLNEKSIQAELHARLFLLL